MEKAFAKLFGNYALSVSGWPTEAGYYLTGLDGGYINTSEKTADEIWALASNLDSANHIMTAYSNVSQNGIQKWRMYSVIGVQTLEDGARVLKLRNPLGAYEWTGAYSDQVNDGIFNMTVEDFKAIFSELLYNYDTSNWHLSYWLKLGDADKIGTTGRWPQCGSTCKNNIFTITSPVKQTIYVATHMHMKRQYAESSC